VCSPRIDIDIGAVVFKCQSCFEDGDICFGGDYWCCDGLTCQVISEPDAPPQYRCRTCLGEGGDCMSGGDGSCCEGLACVPHFDVAMGYQKSCLSCVGEGDDCVRGIGGVSCCEGLTCKYTTGSVLIPSTCVPSEVCSGWGVGCQDDSECCSFMTCGPVNQGIPTICGYFN
jgi:hypothetical protein